MIATPDQRIRVFVSSTLEELAEERTAVARAIESLHLTPVLFEIGARPHSPRDLYRAYLDQSDVFIGVYWQSYGWVGGGLGVSGIEEELSLAADKPRLVYLKTPAPQRDPLLSQMIERIQRDGDISYRKFSTTEELTSLVTNDLMVLISESFQESASSSPEVLAGKPPAALPGLKAFVFTDVVASTERLAAMGDIQADVMRRRHFDLMRSAITAHGGREVKNLGDGLMVAFTTSIDAVAAAVALQHAIGRHNRRTGDNLEVRVGIQVGEATAEEDDFFGRAVVEARRLCDAATGGQILVTDLVKSLAAARSPYPFAALGLMPLKGLGDTYVFEVMIGGQSDRRLPLPDTPALRRRSLYVGRRLEQRRLRQLWDEAGGGNPMLAVVSGEPGIGKTRLAAEFARAVHEDGALVLWGRSSEGLLLPYQPFLEMFRFYVSHISPEILREQLGPSAAFLGTIVPELMALFPDAGQARSQDPRGAREQLFDSASRLLAEVTAASPALLVLDDVQWADEASLLLFKHLVRSPREVTALFIATCRDSELGPGHPFNAVLSDLARDRLVHRLQLTGLSEPEAGSLFGALVGFDPNQTVVHDVATGTQGNPFFVEEVARQVTERGFRLDEPVGGPGVMERLGVPEGVRALSQRRLERLSGPTREVLATAAILGEQFDCEVVAAVTGQADPPLLDLLDEAVAAGLLVEVPNRIGSYFFSHALIRQTLLEGHSLNRRAALHAQVAQALETLYESDPAPVLTDLARHFSEAGRPWAAKAVHYGRAAGEEAMAMLAHEDAVKRFREALEAHDSVSSRDDSTKAELLLLLGQALNRAGDVPAARITFQQAAEVAKATANGDALAQAALGYGSVSGFGGVWYTYAVVDEILVGLLEDALAARPKEDEPLRAQLLGSLAQALYWSPDSGRMLELSEEALAMARRLDDPGVLAHALDSRHVALWNPDTLEERTGLAYEMLRLAEGARHRDLCLEAYAWLITDLLESGDLHVMDRYIAAHTRLAEELRQPYHLWYTAAVRAMRAFTTGDYDATMALVEEAWRYGEHAHGANAQQTYLVQKLFVGRETDLLAPMVPDLAAYVEQTPLVYGWRCALAFAYAETGHRPEAIAQLEYLAEDGFFRIRPDCIWLATLSMLAQVVIRFEVAEHAETLYKLLEKYEGRRIVVGGAVLCFGPVGRFLGGLARVQGRFDDALAHLEKALAEVATDEMSPLEARIRFEIAKVMRKRDGVGDQARAQAMLDEAEAVARKLGMPGLLRDIADEFQPSIQVPGPRDPVA